MAEGQKIMLTITGRQYPPDWKEQDGEDAAIVTRTEVPALYYRRGEEHYLFYEEQPEGCQEPVKNRIRFREGYLELNRQGIYGCRMTFAEGESHPTRYPTPYGKLPLDVATERILFKKREDATEESLDVEIAYALINEGQPIGTYRLRLEIHFKGFAPPFS